MSQSHQPMPKWNPRLTMRVVGLMKSQSIKYSPAQIARLLSETQSAVSQAMINLNRRRVLDREPCPCGRGFIYWRIK